MPHGGVLSVPALHGLGLCVFADLADVYQLCGLLLVLGMEFQSGQNCVTEINCVLCCKSQQDCAMVRKMQRRHAQMQRCRAQMQRYRAQNAETSAQI